MAGRISISDSSSSKITTRTYHWLLTITYKLRESGPGIYWIKGYFLLPRFLKRELNSKLLFNIIFRYLFSWRKSFYLSVSEDSVRVFRAPPRPAPPRPAPPREDDIFILFLFDFFLHIVCLFVCLFLSFFL